MSTSDGSDPQVHGPSGQRIIIIGGKGGVGRTTVAVALAVALARVGRRTLLTHVRCRQNLARLLGLKRPLTDEIRQVEPNLWAVNMHPQAAIREMGMKVLRFRALYRAVLENRVIRSFLRAVPALEEYSMIGKAWYHTTETLDDGRPLYETVIFDGPATGHLISMLRIPQVILDAVPDGPLTTDARKARELLSDPHRTSMWIVTLAEEMPTSEAIELYQAARAELSVPVDRLVVNALYPDDFGEPRFQGALDRLAAAELSPALAALVRPAVLLHQRRQINDDQLRLLHRQLPLPRIDLPHLFTAAVDRSNLEQLVAPIAAALGHQAVEES